METDSNQMEASKTKIYLVFLCLMKKANKVRTDMET